jgi:hypothetical protein
MTAERCFLWDGKMREARKFERIWRQGAGVFCSYRGESVCLNKLESKAEARLVLSLLRKKIEAGLGNNSNVKHRSAQKNKSS